MTINNYKLFALFLALFISVQSKKEFKRLDLQNLFNSLNESLGSELSKFKSIIDHTSTLLQDYAFIDILKAPPKVKGEEYFKKTDIISKLEKLKSELNSETKFYYFHQELIKIIKSSYDPHITYSFVGFKNTGDVRNVLNSVFVMSPVTYVFRKVEDSFKTYAAPNQILELYKAIPEGYSIDLVKEKLKNNIAISTINGKTPYEYFESFADEYVTYKGRDATFTVKKHNFQIFDLYDMPLDVGELKYLEIVYEDGDKMTTEFVAGMNVDVNSNSPNESENEETFEEFIEKNNKNYRDNKNLIIDYRENLKNYYIKYPHKKPKDFEEIQNLISNKQEKNEENAQISWNYSSEDKTFKCRVDEANKLNILYQSSFTPDLDKFEEFYNKTFTNCVNLFHSNDYKIVIIFNLNGGGLIILSHLLAKAIQPLFRPEFKFSEFLGPQYLKICKAGKEHASIYSQDLGVGYRNCEEVFSESNIVTDTYENGDANIKLNRIRQASIQHPGEIELYIDLEKLLKKNRKPTEIIIFTDGYSFSATSIFTKSLHYFGGAILVGYNGDPRSKATDFDASQAPTNILTSFGYTEDAKKLEDLGYKLHQFSYRPLYKDRYQKGTQQIPEEFVVNNVDERWEFYESYSDESYNSFVQKANEIFEKYKTKCNVNNPYLLNMDAKCDSKFRMNTHGGNPCGSDGAWNLTACKPFYCDKRFVFDYVTEQCLPDTQYTQYTEIKDRLEYSELNKTLTDTQSSQKAYKGATIALGVISGVFLIVIIILVCKLRKSTTSTDEFGLLAKS